MAQVVRTGPQPFMAKEKLTVSTTSVPLTEATFVTGAGLAHKKAGSAHITIEDAGIRVQYDGTAPVDATDTGHAYAAGSIITLDSLSQLKGFRAVRVGGTDAVINVTYWEGA